MKQDQASFIVDAHGIADMMEDAIECNDLEENNPGLYGAYLALMDEAGFEVEIAEG